MTRATAPAPTEPPDQNARGLSRFGARAALGWVAVVAGAVPFLALLLLVQREVAPLQRLDQRVADALNEQANAAPALVDLLRVITEAGGHPFAIYVFTLTSAWFWVRRQRRLAAYVATTGLGLAVLVPVTKALVDRARPEVLMPVVSTPSNASFPSGHSMVSIVTAGMLVLVLLPAVPRRWRPVLIAIGVSLPIIVGVTRLALGVHFLSDVLAGWALGVAWLAVMTATFRAWQRGQAVPHRSVADGVDPDAVERQQVTGGERLLPRGRTTALRLLAAATAVWLVLSALGLLVTNLLVETGLGRWEDDLITEVLALRTSQRTDIAQGVSMLSGTPMVIALSFALCVLGVATRTTWRPAVFVAIVVPGEVLLYFFTSEVVDRARPDVPDLTSGLPVAASWPSGHVAAAVAVYGALAALVIFYGRTRWRWAALALPAVLAPAIGASRIYVAAHHPTDVVAGLLLGTIWVLICTRLLLADQTEPAPDCAWQGSTRRRLPEPPRPAHSAACGDAAPRHRAAAHARGR